MIDTCQRCSNSRANQTLRSLANAGFQNRGVCLQAFPSFPSSSPHFQFLALLSFLARPKPRSRSSVFLCSETKRKRLLRRLISALKLTFILIENNPCVDKKHPKSGGFSSLRSTFIGIFQYNLSLSPFFPNFWVVGLGTLSNSLFFGDPQNCC